MSLDPVRAALLICDLQNDFIHPDGAYARGGQASAGIAALPTRIKPLGDAMRAAGGAIIGTRFTLVPGRSGEPMIPDHLKAIRPFLRKGDFLPGSWGSATVDALQPVDIEVEKVAFSAFYMSRLDWVLRKLDVTQLLVCGIVTSGGVASTVRDAHVRDFEITVLEDGCFDFSAAEHNTAIAALRKVARIATIADMLTEVHGLPR